MAMQENWAICIIICDGKTRTSVLENHLMNEISSLVFNDIVL
jgi:hypothetical protein